MYRIYRPKLKMLTLILKSSFMDNNKPSIKYKPILDKCNNLSVVGRNSKRKEQ